MAFHVLRQVLVACLFSFFVVGCGGYTTQSDCNADVAGCGQKPAGDTNTTPDTTPDTECTTEEIAAAMAAIPDCPAGTYHDLNTFCVDGEYLVYATCVQMEEGTEPFDCLNAYTTAAALCDGTLRFVCEASTGYLSTTCTPDPEVAEVAECPSAADVVVICGENGVASYTCPDGIPTVVCNETVVEEPEVVLACDPTFAEAVIGCEYGLNTYSCDGSTGTPAVDCFEAPEEAEAAAESECLTASEVTAICGDNDVESYSCPDGTPSVTCSEGASDSGGGDTGTETGACDDGSDNDGEGLTDNDDPDCHSDADPTNSASYDSSLEEDLFDAEGEYSCCLDMNSDGRCTYTDGSGDVNGEAYTGANLWTYFNSYGTTYDVCDSWNDGEDDRIDQDGDGTAAADGDCNDTDATVKPGATEVCDGYDNDCDGLIDEVSDSDGDGHSDPGCSATGDDCNDAASSSYPGLNGSGVEATDAPDDTVDQDCSGTDGDQDLDGDHYCDSGVDANLDGDCADSGEASTTSYDCNDYASSYYPGAADGIDGVDQDCDGIDG